MSASPLTQLSQQEYSRLLKKAAEADILREQLFSIREAVDAVLTNEEHAYSGGMRSYQNGSPTWQVYEDLRIAILPLTATNTVKICERIAA